jgi:hypothetical protein
VQIVGTTEGLAKKRGVELVHNNPILDEHAATIRKLGKRVTEEIIEIGRLLTESKEILGHGNWLPWIEREFKWSDKTAERFINVYGLSSKFDNLSNLEVPITGLYLLAAPSTPEGARVEVIERAERGETVTNTELKAIIGKHKEPQSPVSKSLMSPVLKPAWADGKPSPTTAPARPRPDTNLPILPGPPLLPGRSAEPTKAQPNAGNTEDTAAERGNGENAPAATAKTDEVVHRTLTIIQISAGAAIPIFESHYPKLVGLLREVVDECEAHLIPLNTNNDSAEAAS